MTKTNKRKQLRAASDQQLARNQGSQLDNPRLRSTPNHVGLEVDLLPAILPSDELAAPDHTLTTGLCMQWAEQRTPLSHACTPDPQSGS